MSCSFIPGHVVYPRHPDPTWGRAAPAERRHLEHREALRFTEYRTETEQHIRTNQYDFTLQFEYKVEDGIVKTRCRTPGNPRKMQNGDLLPSDASACTWHPYNGSGVPHDASDKSFLKPGEYIAGVSVASDTVAAATNTGRVYLYKPTKDSRPSSWMKKWGFPKGKVFLPPGCTSWSLGCAIGDKLKKRVDFMHPLERTTTYTDDDQHVHDVGYVDTLVAIEHDGKTMRYGDTGLALLGRGLLAPMPDDPNARCLKVSDAGSTLFACSVNGERDAEGRTKYHYFVMGTWDYEANGSAPGFYYSVERTGPQPLKDGRTPLGEGERALPRRGWVLDKLIGIDPRATLSPNISAHVTGHGSSERELRIEAHDRFGYKGYYHRKLNEKVWTFLATTAATACTRMLGPRCRAPTFWHTLATTLPSAHSTAAAPVAHTSPPPLVKPYSGVFLGNVGITISFHHFLNSMDPVPLTLQYGGECVTLTLRFTDCWGITKFSEMLGTYEQPKPLNTIISLSPDQLTWCEDPYVNTPLINILRRYFYPYHNRTNVLVAVGDHHKVTLHSTDRHLELSVLRPVARSEIESSFFMRFVNAPHLTQEARNREEALVLLHRNQRALKDLEAIHHEAIRSNVGALAFTTLLSIARPILARVAPHFDIPIPGYDKLPIKRMGAKALADTRGMFQGHREANAAAITRKHFIYDEACGVLRERIRKLERAARGGLP